MERLRIAQQSAAQKRKKHRRKQTWLSSISSTDLPLRTQSACELQRHSPSPQRSYVELRPDQTLLTEEQAVWYLTLPEKVRRQQFSKEEQTLLTEQCEKRLQDARQGSPAELDELERSASIDCNLSRASSQQSAHLTSDDGQQVSDNESSSQDSLETVDAEMAIFKLYSRKRASVATAVKDVPPLPTVPPPPPPNARPKRRSIHRALRLTPLALPPPTLAPLPAMPSPSTMRNFKVAARLSRPYIDPIIVPPAAPSLQAASYRHPQARKHLRQYIASPENFDEAIEFGFPSPELPPPSSSGTDTSLPFLKDPSLHSNDGDDASIDTNSPSTPTVAPEDVHRRVAQSASFDSGIGLPLQINAMNCKTLQSRSSSSTSNRDLTLHMTLTRPGLKATEEKLYSYQRTQTSGVEVASDPLALEVLPFSDDPTGSQGAFAVHDCENMKGLKKVWKSMSIRRR